MSNKRNINEQQGSRFAAVWIAAVALALTCGAQPSGTTSAPANTPATTTAPAEQPPLERLAAEVAIRLTDENGSTYPGDPRGWTDDPYLHQARDWPEPAFLEPLKNLLQHQNAAIALEAAEGLLKYRQPALREAVSALASDNRRLGDETLGALVRARLAVCGDPIGFADDPQCIAPPTDKPNPTMTIPAAAAALSDQSLNVRVQAFRWLALRGIVLTTAPLEESWPALTDEQRLRLLQDCTAGPSYGGLEELRAAAERLAKGDWVSTSSVETRRAMLELLADVDAPVMRDFVTDLLRPAPPEQFQETAASTAAALGPPYGEVLDSTAAEWREPDHSLAVRWTRGVNDTARWRGMACLVRSRDVACHAAAMDALWSTVGRPPVRRPDQQLLTALDLVPRDEQMRWRWARALNAMLQLHMKHVTDEVFSPENELAADLLCRIDGLLVRYADDSGTSRPAKNLMGQFIVTGADPKLLRQRVTERNRWIIENDPGDER
ncbi:MAG: hypothetical protein PVJ57_01850 [Phycisphaerae bacterium]